MEEHSQGVKNEKAQILEVAGYHQTHKILDLRCPCKFHLVKEVQGRGKKTGERKPKE